MQTVFAAYLWNLGQQVLFFKVLAGRITVPNTELFTIRLDIAKITNIVIEHIILITDLLEFTRWAVDFLVHSEQAHFLAVYSALRSFFSQGYSYRINFWDCSSKAKWFLYKLVYNNVTNTRVAVGLHLATSIDFLYSKSVISCLNT